MHPLLVFLILLAASGAPALLLGRRSRVSQYLSAGMLVIGAAMGIVLAVNAMVGGRNFDVELPGPIQSLTLTLRLDALSAFFLFPICIVGAAGAIYGLDYWKQERHPRSGRRLRFCYGLLVSGMCAVVLAADAIAFLFAWEVMALSAFFLVCAEEYKIEARQAGWLYLIATHIGTLALFGMFAVLRAASGTFEFDALTSSQAGLDVRLAIFLLALIGFGVKAGMMPFHFWLPSAHANAPSHISAILSGVVLKIGIYGLLRTLSLLPPPPPSWGALVLALGTISAVLGVVFALGQHDLKRLLAYHSIENIGIILMGLGLAIIGQASHKPEWIVLGMAGCLLHVWNHALFKSLLFLAAGAVVHATRTREIDLMGGLAKRMPRTCAMFLIGAVAICGLPPLNGFVSELLIYLGLFRSVAESASVVALAAPALAWVGALALACFVKAFGGVFLGASRSSRSTGRIHDASPAMTLSMMLLAAGCVSIGVVPQWVIHPLSIVVAQWDSTLDPTAAATAMSPLASITPITLILAGALVLIGIISRAGGWVARRGRAGITWDCGYVRPTARMQYTASSFAASLVHLFRSVLRPRMHTPRLDAAFPAQSHATHFHSHVDDVVLDGLLTPFWRKLRAALSHARLLQQGSIQSYIFYILIILAVLLVLTMPMSQAIRALVGWETP